MSLPRPGATFALLIAIAALASGGAEAEAQTGLVVQAIRFEGNVTTAGGRVAAAVSGSHDRTQGNGTARS